SDNLGEDFFRLCPLSSRCQVHLAQRSPISRIPYLESPAKRANNSSGVERRTPVLTKIIVPRSTPLLRRNFVASSSSSESPTTTIRLSSGAAIPYFQDPLFREPRQTSEQFVGGGAAHPCINKDYRAQIRALAS